jgi:hypothetical protein
VYLRSCRISGGSFGCPLWTAAFFFAAALPLYAAPEAGHNLYLAAADRNSSYAVLANGNIRRCAANGQLTANAAGVDPPVLLAALSGDGKFLAIGHGIPAQLTMLAADDLRILKSLDLRDLAQRPLEPVQLSDAAPRKSIVAIMGDGLEAWEILYDPNAPPVFDGYVHDYRSGEGIATTGAFPVRRIALGQPIGPGLFDPAFDHLIASEGRTRLAVINLNVRRAIARIDVATQHFPHLGASWRDVGGLRYAIPAAGNSIALVESRTWKVERRAATPAPAAGVKHDAATGTLWLWYRDDRVKNQIDVFDARDLAPIATLIAPNGSGVASLRTGRSGQITVVTENGLAYVFDAGTRQRVEGIVESPSDCGIAR